MSNAQDLVNILEKYGVNFEIKANGSTFCSDDIDTGRIQEIQHNMLIVKFESIRRTDGDYAAWMMWQESGDGFKMPSVNKIRKKSEKSRLLDDITQCVFENEPDKAIELVRFYKDFAGPIDLENIPLSSGIKPVTGNHSLVNGQFGKIVAYLVPAERSFGTSLSNHKFLARNDTTTDDLDSEFSENYIKRNGIGYHAELVTRDMRALGGARYLYQDDMITIWGHSVKYGNIHHTLLPWVEECFRGSCVDNRMKYSETAQNETLNLILGTKLCNDFRNIFETAEEVGKKSEMREELDEIPF